MVINGPVAIAGSIPLLSKKSGIKVPIIPATIITITNEIEIAKATRYSSGFHVIINKNKMIAKITPFNMAKTTLKLPVQLIISEMFMINRVIQKRPLNIIKSHYK